MYIFWFLHQTTTTRTATISSISCISFDSYIKPQLYRLVIMAAVCCISFDSYIKPQLIKSWATFRVCCISFDSYIKPQLFTFAKVIQKVVYLLIPTSNHNLWQTVCQTSLLYIFWFLHQTTTLRRLSRYLNSCISFDSYIKPQLRILLLHHIRVVYLLIPTSNHNL